jgi:NitT/TauT family transport system substrate-binding protein
MRAQQATGWTRRRFLGRLTLAGTAGLLGLSPRPVAAEPPLETTTLKLIHISPSVCSAPQYVAEALLQGEGFTEVHYVQKEGRVQANQALVSGEGHLTISFVVDAIIQVDTGEPIVILSGGPVGCFEVFAADHIRSIRALHGKRVGVTEVGSGRHLFFASVLASVGLDPRTDVHFVTAPAAEARRLFTAGHLDAYMPLDVEGQELRAQQVGHVLLNSAKDRPWSQYFCCMIAGNREFIRQSPIATKRALRAILKAADVCAREPERVARFLVDKGYTPRIDYALQMLKALPYSKWREDDDPEDSVRFYALRLHEVGMIKSTPHKIIAQGTDWHFLNEIKRELKG